MHFSPSVHALLTYVMCGKAIATRTMDAIGTAVQFLGFKDKHACRLLCSWKLCTYITLLGCCCSMAAHEAARNEGKIRSARAYLSSPTEPEHAGVPPAVYLI